MWPDSLYSVGDKNSLLVFHRKDLCEARGKPEMSSNFQITFSDIPPPVSDQVKTEMQIFR